MSSIERPAAVQRGRPSSVVDWFGNVPQGQRSPAAYGVTHSVWRSASAVRSTGESSGSMCGSVAPGTSL